MSYFHVWLLNWLRRQFFKFQKYLSNASIVDGERNCNPLQYSCLECPVDRGAWWTAVYGAAQSRT